MTATPTLSDTRQVLEDLLADIERDIERESDYRGSTYDDLCFQQIRLRLALAGLADAESRLR